MLVRNQIQDLQGASVFLMQPLCGRIEPTQVADHHITL
jgi:hypothetical protein